MHKPIPTTYSCK